MGVVVCEGEGEEGRIGTINITTGSNNINMYHKTYKKVHVV